MAPLKAFEDIFSTEEERREERLEHIREVSTKGIKGTVPTGRKK